MKWGIIYHSHPNRRAEKVKWGELERGLQERKIDYVGKICRELDELQKVAFDMAKEQMDVVVVVGGDSALNAVVDGIMKCDEPHPVVGVVPNGFGNDFAYFWEMLKNDDLEKKLDRLFRYQTRKVDVGVCKYVDFNDFERERYFLNCVNIGLAASITNIRRSVRRFLGRTIISEIMSSLWLIFKRKSFKVVFRLPGERHERRAMSICVGSGRGYGQTPSAVPYNGLLDVSLILNSKLWQIFYGLWLMFTGRFLAIRTLQVWRTKYIHFEGMGNAPVSMDGYVVPHKVKKMKVEIKAEEIEFIV